jgi:hypothetical protein
LPSTFSCLLNLDLDDYNTPRVFVSELQDLVLESFLHSPSYELEFVDAGDGDIKIEGEDECSRTPAFRMETMLTAELPEACKIVSRFPASKLRIALTNTSVKSLDSVQGRVVTAEGEAMYFKPRQVMREPDFERELLILSKIAASGMPPDLNVPKLLGLVVAGDNGETTVGMLLTHITGHDLCSPNLHRRVDLHREWEEQITTVVQDLHAHDIVWGDVNPSNVMIDEAMDACAIDFGGMNNVEFVDDDLRETMQGDDQGVKRLFKEWLPRRARAVNEGVRG